MVQNKVNHTVIRVVIADDHPILRHHIQHLFASTKDIRVVGEAGNGYEAIQLVEQLNPDILLLDIEMPEMNGILVAKVLEAMSADVKTVILSSYCDREFVESVLQYRVSGYIVKDDAPMVLISALREIASSGNQWFSRRIQEVMTR